MSRYSRRKLLISAGLLLASSPLALAQQSSKVWRIGVLGTQLAPKSTKVGSFGAFTQAMRDLGYAEGKNLVIEWRFADGKFERLPVLAADLVHQNLDVIVTAGGTRSAKAARQATATIPIVFVGVGDPVRAGVATSLAKPGGNVTGITNMAGNLELKRFELLREILPRLNRIAYLSNPDIEGSLIDAKEMQVALRRIGVDVLWLNVRNAEEIDYAFAEMGRKKVRGAIFATEDSMHQQVQRLADLATRNRIPAAMGFTDAVEAGLLVCYAVNTAANYAHAAVYVDKILKGAKPADLPVEQPTRFELVVNLKTAKTLGITIPKTLLFRADRVIE